MFESMTKITKSQRTVTKSVNNNNNKYIYRDFETCSVSATYLPPCYPFHLFSLQVRARIYYYILLLRLLLFLLLYAFYVAYSSWRKSFFNFFLAVSNDDTRIGNIENENPPYSLAVIIMRHWLYGTIWQEFRRAHKLENRRKMDSHFYCSKGLFGRWRASWLIWNYIRIRA